MVDAGSDQWLGPVASGAQLPLEAVEGRQISFSVEPAPGYASSVASALLTFNQGAVQIENVAPYALFGNRGADFLGGATLTPGNYVVEARFFDAPGGQGSQLATERLTFSIDAGGTQPPSPPPPPPPPTNPGDVEISGEQMVWHTVALTVDGPNLSEAGSINPFTDYRLDVTFSQGGRSFTVPGYYAACGVAAESGCDSGTKWRAKFAPDRPGQWSYAVSFRTGSDVALSAGGEPVSGVDGLSGTFSVEASDKTGRDFRAPGNGRLSYGDAHYLLYPDGRPFFKAGPDAPENTLAYDEFDATPNVSNRRKSWSLHLQDYDFNDALAYTWRGGFGSELLGAWGYLADVGVNAVSFLTFSLAGDDDNVFPHLLRVTQSQYQGMSDGQRWSQGVHHDRFDVSKLDQWDRIFSYGDQIGLFLHFKTMETENDQLMDGGQFGRERQLYYRELIARFGHHLALNWNLGEEYSLNENVSRATADYIAATDPYDHLRVLHTFPGQRNLRYAPLLGDQSELTGVSIQTSNPSFTEVRSALTEWVSRSAQAGDPWVVGLDEPGSASLGVGVDDAYPDNLLPGSDGQGDNRVNTRHRVLWNAFTAGSAGVEYYYGYQTGCGDLRCQDHRTRASKWADARIALDFMEEYVGAQALSMTASDALLTTNGVQSNDHYLFADEGEIYVAFAPTDAAGQQLNLSGQSGVFEVRWYDPLSGGLLQTGSTPSVSGGGVRNLGAPPSNPGGEWVILIRRL